MMIGVTGATGQLGRLVIGRLKEVHSANHIIALVRSLEKAADLGVTARLADYDNITSLNSALKGIDTLILISANEVGRRAAQHKNVIDASVEAGIKRIIYTSLLHASTSKVNLAPEHAETEEYLIQSGIPYTILRNGWYTENFAGSIKGAVESGTLWGSAGDGRVSGASRPDYAEAAVTVATEDGHVHKVYELAGDTSFTLSELAAAISSASGKEIVYRDISESEYTQALISAGVPEEFAAMVASWDVATRQGELFDDSRQLSKLIDRKTTSLDETVRSLLSS